MNNKIVSQSIYIYIYKKKSKIWKNSTIGNRRNALIETLYFLNTILHIYNISFQS